MKPTMLPGGFVVSLILLVLLIASSANAQTTSSTDACAQCIAEEKKTVSVDACSPEFFSYVERYCESACTNLTTLRQTVRAPCSTLPSTTKPFFKPSTLIAPLPTAPSSSTTKLPFFAPITLVNGVPVSASATGAAGSSVTATPSTSTTGVRSPSSSPTSPAAGASEDGENTAVTHTVTVVAVTVSVIAVVLVLGGMYYMWRRRRLSRKMEEGMEEEEEEEEKVSMHTIESGLMFDPPGYKRRPEGNGPRHSVVTVRFLPPVHRR